VVPALRAHKKSHAVPPPCWRSTQGAWIHCACSRESASTSRHERTRIKTNMNQIMCVDQHLRGSTLRDQHSVDLNAGQKAAKMVHLAMQHVVGGGARGLHRYRARAVSRDKMPHHPRTCAAWLECLHILPLEPPKRDWHRERHLHPCGSVSTNWHCNQTCLKQRDHDQAGIAHHRRSCHLLECRGCPRHRSQARPVKKQTPLVSTRTTRRTPRRHPA